MQPGVGARLGRRGQAERRLGAGEPRRGLRLHDPVLLDEDLARLHVWVVGGLAELEDRRHAGVGTVEDRAPLVAGPRLEARGDQGPEVVELVELELAGRLVLDAEQLDELGEELRLQRADGHVLAVGGLVDVVERRATVEQVAGPALVEGSGGEERGEHDVEVCGAVDDRGVDHLPLSRHLALEQCGQDADDEVRRSAAEVADQVRGELRLLLHLAQAVQSAGDRDVVHVVAGGLAPRAVLAPAGHPAVDQPRVAGVADVGADAEPLGDARTHALDQDVGVGDEVEDDLRGTRVLEVQRHAGASAVEQVVAAAGEQLAARPLDPDHVGAEVGQDRAGVRAGADAGDLDDLDAAQRSGALTQGEALERHAADHDTTLTVTLSRSGAGRVVSSPGRSARARSAWGRCSSSPHPRRSPTSS